MRHPFVVGIMRVNFSYVKYDNLRELVEIQENIIFKLTRKVKLDHTQSGHFSKMKVNKAKQILSREVSSSLKFLADQNEKGKYITTAWFIEVVSKWFSLITARNPQVALGNNRTQESYQKFNGAVKFLHTVITLFRNIKIGSGKRRKTEGKIFQTIQKKINENFIYAFKPVQSGIFFITKSVIEITDYLLKENHYLFVLAGRLTQDYVENLFSLVRAK